MPVGASPKPPSAAVLWFLERLDLDEPLDEDWAAAFICKVIKFQIEAIEKNPSQTAEAANARLRDCRTLTDLVRNLDRLDAAKRRRDRKGIRANVKDETFKDELVRKLDQLLAAEREGDGSGGVEPDGGGTSAA